MICSFGLGLGLGPVPGSLTPGGSDRGFTGRFGSQGSSPAQEGEGSAEATGGYSQTQTGPSAADRPAVTVIHVSWQPIDEGGVPGQVVGHAGCIRAQGDGAEDP